jgi:hypothetical protein
MPKGAAEALAADDPDRFVSARADHMAQQEIALMREMGVEPPRESAQREPDIDTGEDGW